MIVVIEDVSITRLRSAFMSQMTCSKSRGRSKKQTYPLTGLNLISRTWSFIYES